MSHAPRPDREPPLLTRDFALLMLGHFLQSLGFASLLLMPLYLDHLGASRTEVGAVLSASAVGGLAVRPVVGWALDRLGRKITITLGTFALSLGLLGVGAVQSVGALVVGVHVLIGVGTGSLMTAYFTLAADLVPPARRTEGLALFGIGGLVTMAVNPLAGALGVEGADLRAFYPGVGLVVLSSLLALIPLPGRPQGTASPGFTLAAVGRALAHRGLWPVWWATVVFSFMVAVFMAYATVAAADRGLANPGGVWLTYAIGAVSVRLLGARLPERVGPSRMIPPALLAYAGALAGAAVAAGPWGFGAVGLLAGFGHGYAFPVLTGQVVTRTAPEVRGSAMSSFTALWEIVKLLLLPAAGALADATSDGVMLALCSGLAAVSLLGWAALERVAAVGFGGAPEGWAR